MILKRFFSILVVCLLLVTATTVGVAAQDTTREAVIDSILEYHHNSITEDDLAYLLYEPLSNGGIFCMWDLDVDHATVTVPVQLGKYVIDGNKGFGYHVYYQGTLYRIEKAYEIGALTEEDLESLFAAGTLRIYDTVEPTETQDTTREAVIDSILEYHHNSITEDDLAYLLYEPLSNGGIFCNWDLKTVGHATVTVPVQLGKYVIDGNKGFGYHVYYQGTLYRIEKAYEIGVLTEEDLESLFAAGTLRIYDIVEPTETQASTSATQNKATPSSAGKSASGPAIKTGDTVIGFVGIALLMCAAVCVMIRRRKTEE